MHPLRFSHPKIATDLVVDGANEITWGYSLNVQNYSTYAGEVVQMLSAYVDDLNVIGDVRSYAEMEAIYKWFLDYIQLATAGANGGPTYNEDVVTMTYEHRNWTLAIKPTSLPGFRMGTEVVVPQWQLQAAVTHQPGKDDDVMRITMEEAEKLLGKNDSFLTLNGTIGYNPENPFSDPKARGPNASGQMVTLKDEYKNLADWYNSLIPSYLNQETFFAGDGSSSRPVTTDDTTVKEEAKPKK